MPTLATWHPSLGESVQVNKSRDYCFLDTVPGTLRYRNRQVQELSRLFRVPYLGQSIWVCVCECVCVWVCVCIIFVCLGCLNKIPQTGWVKQQEFIFSQFWRLQVWDQVVSRISFSRGLSPWLVDGCFLPLFSHGLSSVCVCVLTSSSDTSHIGLGPTLMTSFYLNYLFKGPISKYSHILEVLGVRTSTEELGRREHNSTRNRSVSRFMF